MDTLITLTDLLTFVKTARYWQ